jgi:murein DD-endopeptidase MepM/ murein hydrolase activator NlpD
LGPPTPASCNRAHGVFLISGRNFQRYNRFVRGFRAADSFYARLIYYPRFVAAGLIALALVFPVRGRALGGQSAESISSSTEARAIQPGELVVFTISAPVNTTAVTVRAFGRDTPASRRTDATWIALIGIDLDVTPGAAEATITARTSAGLLVATHSLAVATKEFPTRRLSVNPALVDPPASELPRIKREVARTNSIYGSPAASAFWDGPFVRPVADPENSRFGARSVFNGRRGTPHNGADFLSPAGTIIKTPNAGRVRLAEDLYFSGKTVIIDHGLGLFSLFAHLSDFRVKEGDRVGTGDIIGLVGATGRVTGPHLHWTVRATGARVDPLSLLAVLGAHDAPALSSGRNDVQDTALTPSR